MTAPLILAIPSKGRLMEDSRPAFARAGLEIVQSGNARSYRGTITGIPDVEIAFLSAPEIAREIGATERTIKAHRHNLMEKLQSTSLSELVIIAQCLGVLTSGEDRRHDRAPGG